jgi:hypothetical protein
VKACRLQVRVDLRDMDWGEALHSFELDPSPGSLYTWTKPRCCLMIAYTVASPVPLLGSLVVENGSNRRCLVSAVIPSPVSVTLNSTGAQASPNGGFLDTYG